MKVYLAGPMESSGSPGFNLHVAAQAAKELINAGHIPFVPHLGFLLDAIIPFPREVWLRYARAWLSVCDAVIRLPGKSEGAKEEMVYASELELPCFCTVKDFLKWAEGI